MPENRFGNNKRREYLFKLISITNWSDESQERFLIKHQALSWFSADEKSIEKAIEKLEETVRTFNLDRRDSVD